LADPKLKANASIAQHDRPGPPITQLLVEAHAKAQSRGVSWKGLDFVVTDTPAASPAPIETVLLQVYQKQACQADAIIVGHPIASAYHLSSSGTSVYGDYIVAIDTLLKDNQASSIRLRSDIIVTRPGGSLSLPEGNVNLELLAFPRLQVNVTYFQYLRYIQQSGAYQAIDDLSTLVADGNRWAITRKGFSNVVIPGFTRPSLEASISKSLTSCK